VQALPIPLFSGLAPDDLARLGACLRRRRYRAGQVVFMAGDPGSGLYVVESGRVKLSLSSSDGKEMVVALLGPGDFFGELALLAGEPHPTDAEVRETGDLLVLERTDFVQFLHERPGAAVQVVAEVAGRLRRYTQLAYDVAFLDVSARLARVLLDLAEPRGDGLAVPLKMTQSELAAMVVATRESVNKWLGMFERAGLIRVERDAIAIVQPDALRQRIY
jgi:CRP-like cAMP-binding protein